MASSRAEPRIPSPSLIESPQSQSSPTPKEDEKPAKTADALLDEMLFGGGGGAMTEEEDEKEVKVMDVKYSRLTTARRKLSVFASLKRMKTRVSHTD